MCSNVQAGHVCVCAHARLRVCVRMCVRVSECLCVVVADGCIILIMLDNDARQCCRLLYVCMCTALRGTFLLEKLGK